MHKIRAHLRIDIAHVSVDVVHCRLEVALYVVHRYVSDFCEMFAADVVHVDRFENKLLGAVEQCENVVSEALNLKHPVVCELYVDDSAMLIYRGYLCVLVEQVEHDTDFRESRRQDCCTLTAFEFVQVCVKHHELVDFPIPALLNVIRDKPVVFARVRQLR